MTTVLLVGGAGFIGSFVAQELLKRDCKVVIFDNFTSYISPPLSGFHRSLNQRLQLIGDSALLIRGDATQPLEIRFAIETHQPDMIIHLAGVPITSLNSRYSGEIITSILASTTSILESLRDFDCVKRFIFISSSMVYGDFDYYPADELHTQKPKSIYGGAKLAGEVLTRAFAHVLDIEYVIVRPSAVYGPTDTNRRVSQILLENALKGETLILRGENTTLDFTYVKDAAGGITLAALSPNSTNQIFNISRGEGRSLKDFVTILSQSFTDLKVVIADADSSLPRRGALDISKAQEILNYSPRYSLEDGLAEYIYYVTNSKFPDHNLVDGEY